jgi:anti-anti-sigma factor
MSAELLEVQTNQNVTVARFTRRTILDQAAIDVAGERLRGLVRDGARQLVLSFARVESLTSAMLGQLVALHQDVEAAGGRLAFCHVDAFLAQIFRICNIPQQIPIHPTEADALRALGGEGEPPSEPA